MHSPCCGADVQGDFHVHRMCTFLVVDRQANVRITVRGEMDGARPTLRPTDRVICIARSRMRGFLPPHMVSRRRSNVTYSAQIIGLAVFRA